MSVYYQDEFITLICGDNRMVLPQFPKSDLLLTDPPYGIRADEAAHKNNGKWGWKFYGETSWDRKRPAKETFDLLQASATDSIIWGGNYFTDYLPPSQCWLSWDKGQSNFSLADFELAWTSFNNASRRIVVPRGQALLDGKLHPTQKSLAVMRWCISIADRYAQSKPQTICDPFLGSGTTAVACKELQLKFIGIEIEEKYCEIAARRCEMVQPSFFDTPVERESQDGMFQ